MTDDDGKSLITKAAQILKTRGFTQTSSIHDKIEKGKGVTYTEFEKDGKPYYMRAKEYVYEGKAPFGTEMVTDALADAALLIIYYDSLQTCFVFDPGYVENHGETVTGISKRSDDRTYVEVELDDGAALADYLDGHVTPKTSKERRQRPQRNREVDNTINASLDRFTDP